MKKFVNLILIGDEKYINSIVEQLDEKIKKDNSNIKYILIGAEESLAKKWWDERERCEKYIELYKKQLERLEDMKKREEIKWGK